MKICDVIAIITFSVVAEAPTARKVEIAKNYLPANFRNSLHPVQDRRIILTVYFRMTT